jgi:hypothetical protein
VSAQCREIIATAWALALRVLGSSSWCRDARSRLAARPGARSRSSAARSAAGSRPLGYGAGPRGRTRQHEHGSPSAGVGAIAFTGLQVLDKTACVRVDCCPRCPR